MAKSSALELVADSNSRMVRTLETALPLLINTCEESLFA